MLLAQLFQEGHRSLGVGVPGTDIASTSPVSKQTAE
jgi:hypothetical protein